MPFFNFFTNLNIFQEGCTPQLLHSYAYPDRKLVSLVDQHPQQFKEYIDNLTSSPLTSLQKITLVHLLFLHCDHLTPHLEQISLSRKHEESWLNQNILVPYQNFIRKAIHSSDLYKKIRTINNGWNKVTKADDIYENKNAMRQNPRQYFNLQLMYYSINMMGDLFAILRHICNLGRYYLKNNKKEIEPFVMVTSYQALLLYFAFKFIINQIVFKVDQYLNSPEEHKALRDILTVNLQIINEQMKQLILNKYFNLPSIGIRIKLFELECQGEQNKVLLQKILGSEIYTRSSVEKKKNKKQRKQLGSLIFKKNGEFDNDLFEKSILIMDQSSMEFENLQAFNKQNTNILNEILSVRSIENKIGSQETLQSQTLIV